jgi:hypothetical protein
LHSQTFNRIPDSIRASDRLHRAVESTQRPVTDHLDQPAGLVVDDLAEGILVVHQGGSPLLIAEPGGVGRGADDVCEQQGGEDRVVALRRARAGQPGIDLVEHRTPKVGHRPGVALVVDLKQFRVGNLLGDLGDHGRWDRVVTMAED